MEFIGEDTRPRFLFQARSSSSSSSSRTLHETLEISKIHLASCLSTATILSIIAYSLFSHISIIFITLIWISLSLIFAPFAPSSTTGGDPRVGHGDPLPPLPSKPKEPEDIRRSLASRWNPKSIAPSYSSNGSLNPKLDEKKGADSTGHDTELATKEANLHEEWTTDDFEILKRQISKHPAGAPGRWERVAEAFKGRHGVESVIRAAKSLGERKLHSDDSFAQFLKQRKPLDKRMDAPNAESYVSGTSYDPIVGNVVWSSGEDMSLLNALKTFPKDAAMRWEKVAAALPGKSKVECMKRVTELKRDFRSTKAS